MGGGSKSYSGSAQKWAAPIAKAAAGTVQSVYNAQAPGLQKITEQVQSLLPDLIQNYQDGDANTNAARGYNADVLSGKFLTGNPHLQAMIDQTNEGIRGAVGGAFGSRGAFGGTAYLQAMAREQAKAENALRYNDYNTQMTRMDQAAAQAPAYQAADNQSLQALLAAAGVGAELPYTGINALSGNLASLFSGGTQKTSGGIAGVLGGVGSLMSGIGSMQGK